MQKLKFLVIALFFTTSLFSASVTFSPFIAAQVEIVNKMNEDNVTKEIIESLLREQSHLYDDALNELMSNKSKYISSIKQYESEMFSLKKIISINKRAGNKYAVMRDEVALKSYILLRLQNRMIRSVLQALESETKEEFETILNQLSAINQEEVSKLYEYDYRDILFIQPETKQLKATKENIRDFYALKDVNADLISYLYKLNSKMYRLNKYSKYHLISFVVYIDSFTLVKTVNPILEAYGLSITKLLSIAFLILLFYFFRKIVYVWLEGYLLKIDLLKEYSRDISKKIHKQIDMVVVIMNVNMVIYIYNDFSSTEIITRSFNIVYGFYFTLIIYKVVNTIASIKLRNVNDGSSVKNDLINVGIKIINFIILVIGLLIMLFFAGVNLTAVLSGLGIGGLAVAFAAKDTISNFFGTLSILFSDVFSQGDWIEIDVHQGVVVEIGLRVTTIRTFDNALIAIPNGTFATKDVKNWDRRILGRRIKMHIGVKYDSKSEDIKNAVEEIREMLDKHDGIATKNTKYTHQNEARHIAKLVSKDDLEGVKNNLLVYLDEFSDSSINILIYCFTKSVRWVEWLETKEDVMHQIMRILEENNLEFAFPSLSVYNEDMGK
ncbi:MAG: mechanosensitive ion channel family protein [Campylobacterota bacterium]|nr:mechanosensitive ion channel family protein [Campylobacterota bacterium]